MACSGLKHRIMLQGGDQHRSPDWQSFQCRIRLHGRAIVVPYNILNSDDEKLTLSSPHDEMLSAVLLNIDSRHATIYAAYLRLARYAISSTENAAWMVVTRVISYQIIAAPPGDRTMLPRGSFFEAPSSSPSQPMTTDLHQIRRAGYSCLNYFLYDDDNRVFQLTLHCYVR